ncbi:MAG: hypothetical protein K8U03_14360 [Planctomycetia bacterium]|nr:hypothetical protein [Planctomycetia bacterium]
MKCTPQTYLKILAIGAVFVLGGLVALNVAADPYGAYRGVARLDPNSLQLNSRVLAAERVLQTPCDTLVVGTSRAEAIYAGSPHFDGRPTLNACIRGASLEEQGRLVEYACETNQPKRILFCTDFFQYAVSHKPAGDYHASRLAPGLATFDYHCDKLVGHGALKQSWKIVRSPSFSVFAAAAPRALHPYEPLSGGAVIPVFAGTRRGYFEGDLNTYLSVKGYYGRYIYSPERVKEFRSAVRAALANDVELIVAILPVHAVELESLRAAGLWNTFERWKQDLAVVCREEGAAKSSAAVPVWDFTGYSLQRGEAIPTVESAANMQYFINGSHCTVALGELVLQRIFHEPHSDDTFAGRLDRVDLARHLAAIREDREQWVRSNRAEFENVRQIAKAHQNLVDDAPVLVAAESAAARR